MQYRILRNTPYIILFLIFLKPYSLSYLVPTLDTVLKYCLYIAIAMTIILYLIYLADRKKLNLMVMAITLYELSLCVSTIIGHGDFAGALSEAGTTVCMCLIIDMVIHQDANKGLGMIEFAYELLIYANFISLLIFPGGMYSELYDTWSTKNCWLLGYDNVFILTIFPAIAIAMVRTYSYTKKQRLSLRNLCLFAASYATIFIRWPATSVVALTMTLIFLLFPKLFSARFANIYVYFFTNIAFFLGIIVLRQQTYLSDFITGVLGKDLTFTGRTNIWDASIAWFLKSPAWGYGVQLISVTWSRFGAFHSHNQYLWDLYRGGIIHFSCFLLIVYISMKNLRANRTHPAANWLAWCICIVLMMLQTEAFAVKYIAPIFMMAYNLGYIMPNQQMTRKAKEMVGI